MFEVYTIIEDRTVVVALLANRRQAEQYLRTHDRSCIGTLLIRHAPEQARYRGCENHHADEILEQLLRRHHGEKSTTQEGSQGTSRH